MRAIVYSKYGSPDVLERQDIDRPTLKDDEVLVRVRAAAANPYDWHVMRGTPYFVRLKSGLRKPKKPAVLGSDVAGEVESVGSDVTLFRPGQEVFGVVEAGGFAEYLSFPEDKLGLKPNNQSFEEAAAVPMGALTALQGLRNKGKIETGQKVLINGASGGVGTFAVQIARYFGAEVTGVCSDKNSELVRSLGADYVIDYTRDDFTKGYKRYDLVFDTIGNHSVSEFRHVLVPKGTFVTAGGGGRGRFLGPIIHVLKAVMLSPFVSQKLTLVVTKSNADDLHFLKELIEAGKIKSVIDSTYPLAEVPEAIRHLEEGHAQGKIVITV